MVRPSKDPDGQWVTLRKATHEELTKAMEVLPTALPRVQLQLPTKTKPRVPLQLPITKRRSIFED